MRACDAKLKAKPPPIDTRGAPNTLLPATVPGQSAPPRPPALANTNARPPALAISTTGMGTERAAIREPLDRLPSARPAASASYTEKSSPPVPFVGVFPGEIVGKAHASA